MLSWREQLAEIVKAFPCLYDKTKKGCKEKDVVTNVWNSVANQLDFIEDVKLILFVWDLLKSSQASMTS